MAYTSGRRPPPRASGCFFLPFLFLGLFFLGLIVREVAASAATFAWQALPCRVAESEVRETTSRYTPWYAYLRYAWPGGESVRSSRPFATYTEAVRYTRRWPAGSNTNCYVDPRDPAGALLERRASGLAFALFLPLPLIFVLIGGVGFYSVAFRKPIAPLARRPANPRAARRFAAGLLILAGAVLSAAFLQGPVRRSLAARSWSAQDCRVLSSGVRPRTQSKGSDTWSPEILYAYTADGREHRSDTYGFFDFWSGRQASALRTADRYPRGSVVTCYVNGADPDDAVLQREPSFGWLIGLIPFAMVAAGGALWRASAAVF